MDPAPFPAFARAADHARRNSITCCLEQQIIDVPRGWMCWEPNGDPGEFPSGSPNRIHWVTAESPLNAQEIHDTIAAVRARDIRRMYIIMSPRAWTTGVHSQLLALGATPWPDVVYPLLACPATPTTPARPTDFSVRIVQPQEAPPVYAAATWFPHLRVGRGQRMLDRGISELHAAFDGDQPVALSYLFMDGDFSYLGGAATDPAKKGRGAQTALICSRITRAAALGAKWCVAETNTAVPISLRNLKRCGFEEILYWKVYRWDEPAPAPA
jgi:hypothetical protein